MYIQICKHLEIGQKKEAHLHAQINSAMFNILEYFIF